MKVYFDVANAGRYKKIAKEIFGRLFTNGLYLKYSSEIKRKTSDNMAIYKSWADGSSICSKSFLPLQNRIFVKDDDPGMQDTFRLILEKAGYITTVYEGGKQLLDNDEVPDIYLLDKHLSGMDGLDICRHLKSDNKTKQIPVIIISATPDLAVSSRSWR